MRTITITDSDGVRLTVEVTRGPGAVADVTTIKQWIRCICGHARGRASEPREDCPECGFGSSKATS